MGFQLLRGDNLYREFSKQDLKPSALPVELIRCWEETYIDKKGKTRTRGVSLMKPCEVAQFRTVFFSRCMELYNTWKLFKQSAPLGQGWGNERGITCKILQILEVENNKYDQWERDKEKERK